MSIPPSALLPWGWAQDEGDGSIPSDAQPAHQRSSLAEDTQQEPETHSHVFMGTGRRSR